MNVSINELRGEWALVTGASSGIGREFARQLAAHGVHVILVARRTALIEKLAQELEAATGSRCLAVPLDLSNADAVSTLKATLQSKGIRIRMLVNNAGCGYWGAFEKASPDTYARMLTVNAIAPIVLAHAFFEDLASHHKSVLINVSSGAVFQPVPYMASYAASKTALHSVSLALSEEWRTHGILVQTLVPGPTESEFDAQAGAYDSALGSSRDKPSSVVTASIGALEKGKIFVCVAKGTLVQKIFAALFPPAFVVRKVADMFRPKPQNRDSKHEGH